jgi:hypothetical protein
MLALQITVDLTTTNPLVEYFFAVPAGTQYIQIGTWGTGHFVASYSLAAYDPVAKTFTKDVDATYKAGVETKIDSIAIANGYPGPGLSTLNLPAATWIKITFKVKRGAAKGFGLSVCCCWCLSCLPRPLLPFFCVGGCLTVHGPSSVQHFASTGNACTGAGIAAMCNPDYSTGCEDKGGSVATCTCLPGFFGDLCDKFTPAPGGVCPLPAAASQYKNSAAPTACFCFVFSCFSVLQ